MTMNRCTLIPAFTAVLALAACSGEPKQGGSVPAATAVASPAAPGGAITPDAGRQVITVEMETQPDGSNVFEPALVEAKRGDVIRYMLVTGVHNANFLPDSNAGTSGLPAPSQLLQLPGQTYDVKIDLPVGEYYFHCDPHALLGMVGHLRVTQ